MLQGNKLEEEPEVGNQCKGNPDTNDNTAWSEKSAKGTIGGGDNEGISLKSLVTFHSMKMSCIWEYVCLG